MSRIKFLLLLVLLLLCGCSNTESPEKNVCTLSVSCETILENIESFDQNKIPILPENGVILEKTEVHFTEGETVFDLISREFKDRKIHFEFSKTPLYDSVYIEGIGNIYEFDCGELSGWSYCVNGEFPSCGCSSYTIEKNDVIEWKYTCDLGKDIQNGRTTHE